MRKLILPSLSLIVVALCITAYAQSRGTPNTLRVRIDANGALVTASAAQVNPVTTTTFSNARLATDASGNLLTVIAGGSGVGTVTSVATQGPIGGGPITTTGTITCLTCGVTTSNITQFATTSSANFATNITDETGSGIGGVLVFSNAPTLTLTNGTLLPVSTGISGLGTGIATWLATPSSANLLTAITDETGSGVAVFGTTPTFTTSIIDPLVIGGTAVGSSLLLQSTSGVGTTDFISFRVGSNGGTDGGRVAHAGNWLIGSPLSASASYGTQPIATVHIAGNSSGVYLDRNTGDAVGAVYVGRKSRGTYDSPTQTLANDNLTGLLGLGWETTTPGWTTAASQVLIQATENFTSTAQGTRVAINLIPTGTVTAARLVTFSTSGMIWSQNSATAMAVANVGANSCGTTTATIAGNQTVGEVTVGATSGTQCRVTVPQATTTRFAGSCSNQTTANLCRVVHVSTTQFDLIGTFVAGDVVAYFVASR